MISNVQINFFNLKKKKVQIKLVKLKMKIIQTYIN